MIVLLAIALAISPAGAAGWVSEKTAEADALVARFLAQVDAQGPGLPEASLALGIATGGKLAIAKGYREASPGLPATEHTVYRIGSLAKQFTAAGVLDLIGRHATLRNGTALTLDLALARIFSGVEHWPGKDGGLNTQPVTVQSLLTMTSNLPNFTRLPPAATNPWGRIGAPELLSELKKLKPTGWPNTFEYSNTSYFLLAEVMEEAILPGETVPKSHRDYLRQAIFPRAGLTETGFVDDYAAGTAAAIAVNRRRPVFDQPDWLKGSADIASTITDLVAWNAALMEGRMLPADLRALMFSDGARVTPEIYYGMGWFIEHRRAEDLYSHSGLVPGFTSYNLIAVDTASSEWTSVTLLINTDVTEGLDLLAEDLLRLARE